MLQTIKYVLDSCFCFAMLRLLSVVVSNTNTKYKTSFTRNSYNRPGYVEKTSPLMFVNNLLS